MRGCLTRKHFVRCDKESIEYIRDVMISDASEGDKTMFFCRKNLFDVPEDVGNIMTVIPAKNYKLEVLIMLSSEPAVLVLENIREFEVYRSIAQVYCKDSRFGYLFRYLYERMLSEQIVSSRSAGGYGDIPIILSSLDSGVYIGQAHLKTMSVFDRDTNSSDVYDPKKNGLFELFLCKKSDAVQEADIYSLSRQRYHWHMWYKRAIENYFPERQYKRNGCKLQTGYDRIESDDYIPVKEKYMGYNKNMLNKLTRGMVFADYERKLSSFDVGGVKMSEMQLFLFKIMQVI